MNLFSYMTETDKHKCSLTWNFCARMIKAKLLSPLVCSTVRVGCGAGAEAMSAQKEIDLLLKFKLFRFGMVSVISVTFVTSLHCVDF